MEAERESSGNLRKNSADFWSRGMAFIIDMTLLFFFAAALLCYAVVLILLASPAELAGFIKGLAAILLIFPGIFLSSILVYFTLLHSWGGRTVGKVFMGIKVESCNGQHLGLGVSFLRLAGYCLSILPLGIGFLWAALDKEHAAWHDKLTGSRVVFDC